MTEKWRMKGSLIGACSCDWGCPCNFDARPTKGICEGVYVIEVHEGNYGDVKLDGVKMVWAGKAPGPLHEGNVESVGIVDKSATPEQRAAIETLLEGNGVGSPFDIFAAVTSKRYPTIFAPIDIKLDGIRSSVKVDGFYEVSIDRIRNPVTGDEEEIYLDKPTGFTSLRSEMGASSVMRLTTDSISYDHSGQYAEYAEFEYSGG
jgi:hypothetical protein